MYSSKSFSINVQEKQSPLDKQFQWCKYTKQRQIFLRTSDQTQWSATLSGKTTEISLSASPRISLSFFFLPRVSLFDCLSLGWLSSREFLPHLFPSALFALLARSLRGFRLDSSPQHFTRPRCVATHTISKY
jgi:hypothetical protein